MTRRAISVQLHPELNTLLQSTLDKYGIELFSCASQSEAQRAMLKENYCLAVIDTSMLEKAIQSISDFRLGTYAPIVAYFFFSNRGVRSTSSAGIALRSHHFF